MKKFCVEVITATPNPQQAIWAAMHQDYTEQFVFNSKDKWPDEQSSGELVVKHLLLGDRGHFGPLEHPQITFNVGYFPHSTMQQLRTHRVGISFDVQCLAGDTVVTFVNSEGTTSPKHKKTIEELYDLWTNGEQAIRQRRIKGRNGEQPGLYRRKCRNRIKKMRLRVLNEETGHFEVGHIKDIICSGVQPIYRVTLEDGKSLDCTTSHRLFTSQGWQTMGEAVGLVTAPNGDVKKLTKDGFIMCNGVIVGNGIYRDKVWLQEQLNKGLHADEMADLAGCSIEAIKKWVYAHGLTLNKRLTGTRDPWNKGRGYKLHLSEESLLRRRENAKKYTKRGEQSNFWKGGTSNERELIGAWTRQIAPQVHQKFNYICQKCRRRGGTLHAHHLVPVFADENLAYNFDNLVTLCKECHEYIHQNSQESEFAKTYQPLLETENWQSKPQSTGNQLICHPVKVKSVEYLGKQMTYDLEVEGQWHNFVANGMVVHNSFRYTSQGMIEAAAGLRDIEEIFYLRPVGEYRDRQGKRYYYSQQQREEDLRWCQTACNYYKRKLDEGHSEEHARGILPFDLRQHWVMSVNARSLMHLLDIRGKADSQLEIQQLTEILLQRFKEWMPEVANWYESTRWRKGKLAP